MTDTMDGLCMMEGISGEAASLAGHLKLSKLCWIYDNNHITIEGNTALAYSDDTATRFIGYGWNVTRVGDANDLEMLERAFETFRNTIDRPTLIIVDSHIAYGAPNKQDTSAAHGEPLGKEEIKLAKCTPLPLICLVRTVVPANAILESCSIPNARDAGFPLTPAAGTFPQAQPTRDEM